MKKITFTASPDRPGRLDAYVAMRSGLTRSQIQKIIKNGLLTVNCRNEKTGYKVKNGDIVEFTIADENLYTLAPEEIPLDIIWEDSNIIVINKPPGMVVYPGAGHKSGTLMNAMVSRYGRLASTGAPLRPGVVHRLDKDTSGLIVFARDDKTYLNLCSQFKERCVEKFYLALLYGGPAKDLGEIRTPIGRALSDRKKMSVTTRKGKEAVTRFSVIKRFKSAVMAEIRIITGRTHQIRVHCAAMGYPVLGDKTYGRKNVVKLPGKSITFHRQMLHAYRLKLKHPADGQLLEFTAPVPEDMKKIIEELGEGSD